MFGLQGKIIWARCVSAFAEQKFVLITSLVWATSMPRSPVVPGGVCNPPREEGTRHSGVGGGYILNRPYAVGQRFVLCLRVFTCPFRFLSFVLVFSFGSAEKGQLGNGTTGERITTGNKTSYDIEISPGMLFASSLRRSLS